MKLKYSFQNMNSENEDVFGESVVEQTFDKLSFSCHPLINFSVSSFFPILLWKDIFNNMIKHHFYCLKHKTKFGFSIKSFFNNIKSHTPKAFFNLISSNLIRLIWKWAGQTFKKSYSTNLIIQKTSEFTLSPCTDVLSL